MTVYPYKNIWKTYGKVTDWKSSRRFGVCAMFLRCRNCFEHCKEGLFGKWGTGGIPVISREYKCTIRRQWSSVSEPVLFRQFWWEHWMELWNLPLFFWCLYAGNMIETHCTKRSKNLDSNCDASCHYTTGAIIFTRKITTTTITKRHSRDSSCYVYSFRTSEAFWTTSWTMKHHETSWNHSLLFKLLFTKQNHQLFPFFRSWIWSRCLPAFPVMPRPKLRPAAISGQPSKVSGCRSILRNFTMHWFF